MALQEKNRFQGKKMTALIHEIYASVSGEGITTGVPTIFLRMAGCSLRCGKTLDGRKLWCDTPYALSPHAGKYWEWEAILQEIHGLRGDGYYQILVTGGEPLEGENRLLTQKIAGIASLICNHPHHPFPRIETNGREPLAELQNMVFTMDYKLPGSGMEDRMCLENFSILRERNNILDEVKFVIRDRMDWERALEINKTHWLGRNSLYSPVEGELDPKELVEWIKKTPLPGVRLSLQIHKVLWGNQRGV